MRVFLLKIEGRLQEVSKMNKGKRETLHTVIGIRKRLPFPLLGLDPDSGSEFINWHMKAWCTRLGIELTRSRPNHKNDNAHVEQKNYTAVRKFLGYGRVDTSGAVVVMNELYAGPLRLYLNFFQPVRKCIRKEQVGSKYN